MVSELHPSGTSKGTETKKGGGMKLQNKVRMQMVLMGLGAALLLTSSARAQQDMDPTYFDVNPGTPAVSKVADVRTAQSSPAIVENGNQAESALAIASGKDATLEAGMTRLAVVDAGIVLILLGGVGSIVAYAMAATRRERSPQVYTTSVPYTSKAPYTPVSAAPAQ